MLTQVGYALGLFLFVPLCDIKEKRSLIVGMTGLVAATLLAVGSSVSKAMLLVSAFAMGLITIIPQLIVPLAAHFSDPAERGKNIGFVMSGLLIGILLSRTFSGLVGSYLGWRTVYFNACDSKAYATSAITR